MRKGGFRRRMSSLMGKGWLSGHECAEVDGDVAKWGWCRGSVGSE